MTDSEDGAWLPPPQIYELARLAQLSPSNITLTQRQEQMRHVRRLAPQLVFANNGIVVSALNGCVCEMFKENFLPITLDDSLHVRDNDDADGVQQAPVVVDKKYTELDAATEHRMVFRNAKRKRSIMSSQSAWELHMSASLTSSYGYNATFVPDAQL